MAISIANVHASGPATDLSSYDFALSSLTGGRWLCFDIYNQITSGSANTPSLSGASLTYVAEASLNTDPTARRLSRQYAWNPSTTSYTLTVSFAGQTQIRCGLQVSEIIGADAADPFVQTVTAFSGGGTSITTGTLAAYSNANNRFLGAHYHGVSEATTASHTSLADASIEAAVRFSTQWDASAQPLSPTFDWTSNSAWYAILSEVKADTGGGGAEILDPMGMSGFFGG
jgi:hypothetical protein